jgi:hypothetical protein
VAREAFVGENGAHVAIEIDGLLGGTASPCGEQRKETTNSRMVPLHGYSLDYIQV